jgi:cyanophycinase-like exopeptidase
MRTVLAIAVALLGVGVFAEPIVKGPEHGALVIVGGGKVGDEILGRMFELGGGKDAPLVVIPTASGAADYPADWSGLKMFKDFGAPHITLLHTKDRAVADRSVRQADHVREDRLVRRRTAMALVNSYLHTRTQREIERVLDRGGVVAGSS